VPVFSVTNRGKLLWPFWCCGVFVGSLLPGATKELTHTTGTVHRTVHMVAFGGIALGVYSWPRRYVGKLIANGGVIVSGALIELLQSYFYGSAYKWRDVRDDGIGVMVGCLLATVIIVWANVARQRGKARPEHQTRAFYEARVSAKTGPRP